MNFHIKNPIIRGILRGLGYKPSPSRFHGYRPFNIRAGYSGAQIGPLTSDMVISPTSADTDIRWSLRTLRARCRDLAINNDYVRKFLWMVAANVVGPKGIIFQAKLKTPDGKLDKDKNKAIETTFARWGKRENCTVTGLQSWPSFQRQVIMTVARDGEVFIRKVEGFRNEFGFALQTLEADYVDENYNDRERNIRMGIEYDLWRRPIAYYFLQSNLSDYQAKSYNRTYVRVPASDVIHLFIQERPEQGRGVPWTATPMFRLAMLGGYEENEVVAARAAAGKMGFFKQQQAEQYQGESEDESGDTITEISPGTFEKLPPGVDFVPFDPQHPTTAYGEFVKSCLRGVSSGLLVSYNSLANDLEGVNYSSIRQGVLDERDIWRILQSWFIDSFCQRVLDEWRLSPGVRGRIDRAFLQEQSEALKWQPRGWAWVDPERDQNANIIGIGAGLNTRTRAVGEEGLDLEDIFDELAEEEKMARDRGLTLMTNATKAMEPKEKQPTENTVTLVPKVNLEFKSGDITVQPPDVQVAPPTVKVDVHPKEDLWLSIPSLSPQLLAQTAHHRGIPAHDTALVGTDQEKKLISARDELANAMSRG